MEGSLNLVADLATPTGTPEERIEAAHAEMGAALRQELLNRIVAADPTFFEHLVIDLMLAMGYGGSHTEAARHLGMAGDGGIDGVIDGDPLGLDAVYLQAKKYTPGNSAVERPELQAFVGSLVGRGAHKGVFITTSVFAQTARQYVASVPHKIVPQIELRLLAEIANIEPLQKAFREGLDIHAMTASEMFGVPVKGMPGEVRRRAKAINFGIIYGISAFGLANQLGIEREEAGAYIRKYFERFPGIRDYMDETKAFAKKNGYVLTLFGRKCHYPDIVNSNPSIRAFNERAAINARLQGTAADIIRRAMVRMDAALAQSKLNAQMLLQVHDELVFEVADARSRRRCRW